MFVFVLLVSAFFPWGVLALRRFCFLGGVGLTVWGRVEGCRLKCGCLIGNKDNEVPGLPCPQYSGLVLRNFS